MHLAKIFALASVRQKRAKGKVPTGTAKSPRVNIIVSVVAFPMAAILAPQFTNVFLKDMPVAIFFMNFSIFIPSFMTLIAIMFGILFELQAASTGSTDMINWLPIRPIEYIMSSTLTLTYFLAPVLALAFGATFGIAVSINMADIWLFSLVFGLVGLFLGTFITEILRALMNRVSATFYKRSGRSTVAGRMVVGIFMIVIFMLVFNVNVLLTVLQYFIGGVDNAWFIPILWPTLAIMRHLAAGTMETLLYTLLNMSFTLGLLLTSVKLRAKYWVPIPISIQIAPSKAYTPKRGLLGRLGCTAAESALIWKDFRGLIRRKEMLGWIAIPIAIVIISFITTYSTWTTATTISDKLAFFTGPLIGIVMLAFYLALISIGQEGDAFINLLAAPLKEKEIVKAKLVTVLVPAIGALAVLLVIAQLLINPRMKIMISITVVSFAVVLEAVFIGLATGIRFPDFKVMPRTRFITR
ncbi:MAG: hypothetical protein ACE5R6_17015 [Candidatus Heimdallarchaeota archaeon]